MGKLTDVDMVSINERVAKALGWTDFFRNNRGELIGRSDPHNFLSEVPDYSRSIEAAWQIVSYVENKKIYFDVVISHFKGPVEAQCHMGHTDDGSISWADTAPLAICKAFLELKEKEDK